MVLPIRPTPHPFLTVRLGTDEVVIRNRRPDEPVDSLFPAPTVSEAGSAFLALQNGQDTRFLRDIDFDIRSVLNRVEAVLRSHLPESPIAGLEYRIKLDRTAQEPVKYVRHFDPVSDQIVVNPVQYRALSKEAQRTLLSFQLFRSALGQMQLPILEEHASIYRQLLSEPDAAISNEGPGAELLAQRQGRDRAVDGCAALFSVRSGLGSRLDSETILALAGARLFPSPKLVHAIDVIDGDGMSWDIHTLLTNVPVCDAIFKQTDSQITTETFEAAEEIRSQLLIARMIVSQHDNHRRCVRLLPRTVGKKTWIPHPSVTIQGGVEWPTPGPIQEWEDGRMEVWC